MKQGKELSYRDNKPKQNSHLTETEIRAVKQYLVQNKVKNNSKKTTHELPVTPNMSSQMIYDGKFEHPIAANNYHHKVTTHQKNQAIQSSRVHNKSSSKPTSIKNSTNNEDSKNTIFIGDINKIRGKYNNNKGY